MNAQEAQELTLTHIEEIQEKFEKSAEDFVTNNLNIQIDHLQSIIIDNAKNGQFSCSYAITRLNKENHYFINKLAIRIAQHFESLGYIAIVRNYKSIDISWNINK